MRSLHSENAHSAANCGAPQNQSFTHSEAREGLKQKDKETMSSCCDKEDHYLVSIKSRPHFSKQRNCKRSIQPCRGKTQVLDGTKGMVVDRNGAAPGILMGSGRGLMVRAVGLGYGSY